MFFGAYLGNDCDSLLWKQIMYRHASWLGLSIDLESRRLSDGREFSFGWVKIGLLDKDVLLNETEQYIIINTTKPVFHKNILPRNEKIWKELIDCNDDNVVKVGISLQSGGLRISVPPSTPEQFYYSSDCRGYVVGNDLRLLIRWAGLKIDKCAIYSLFQYSTIPAPLTISSNVKRIPGGFIFQLPSDSNEPSLNAAFKSRKRLHGDNGSLDPETRLQETLDRILMCMPKSSVLYFSGGVDSGLLAARLAEMGRSDIRLLNYVFEPQKQESLLALQMSSHLGLACEQVIYEPSDVHNVLERLGSDYSFPFGDPSAITHNLLVHASLQLADQSHTVINGTGADGAFGMMPSPIRNQICTCPRLARSLITSTSKKLKFWKYNVKVLRYMDTYRYNSSIEPIYKIISTNFFDGIAYNTPDGIQKTLENYIEYWFEKLSLDMEIEEQLSLLDLVFKSAGRYAASSFDPLRTHGVASVYPFLEPTMLHLSLSLRWDEKYENGESKALLKKLLLRSVPKEFVYRPKDHFFPPIEEIFAYDSMQEFMRNVVLSKENPLFDFIQVNVVRQMSDYARKGKLPWKRTYHFLWLLMFTSGWLSQIEL